MTGMAEGREEDEDDELDDTGLDEDMDELRVVLEDVGLTVTVMVISGGQDVAETFP